MVDWDLYTRSEEFSQLFYRVVMLLTTRIFWNQYTVREEEIVALKFEGDLFFFLKFSSWSWKQVRIRDCTLVSVIVSIEPSSVCNILTQSILKWEEGEIWAHIWLVILYGECNYCTGFPWIIYTDKNGVIFFSHKPSYVDLCLNWYKATISKDNVSTFEQLAYPDHLQTLWLHYLSLINFHIS